jgi:hypothetical protein
MLIVRTADQTRIVDGATRRRTVGTYQVYHNGQPVAGLGGAMAEAKRPGDNTLDGNVHDRCIEPGRYPLWTQYGTKYRTLGYDHSPEAAAHTGIKPRPGFELRQTGERSEILVHPAQGFLWSVGCLHPCEALPQGESNINFVDSRKRVIALIDDMKAWLGDNFPKHDGERIPQASIVIDES